jgi:uncharacterized protein YegL
MSDHGVTAVNAGIGELVRSIHNDPVVDVRARVGIIVFDSQAEVVLPLSQLSNIVQIPGCVRSDEPARYASVFRLLKKEIEIDVPRLKSEGFRVRRPIVLFVSGSIPADPDEWRDAHKDLCDEGYRFHPIVFSLGLKGSHSELLTQIATKTSANFPNKDAFVFIVEDVEDTKAIEKFVREMLISLLDLRARVHSHERQMGIDLNILGEINGISQFFTSRTFPQENSITRSGSDLSGGIGLLPFYIVCDEGSSMTDEAITAVNLGIGDLFRAVHGDPIFDAKARVGIITFDDQASVLLPLTELSQVAQIPGCMRTNNPSSYKTVFRLLKAQIETDVLSLEVQGFRVHRPVVFFMSCGKPKFEDWYSAWEELTEKESRLHPHIVSWGTSGAESSIVAKVATNWGSGTNSRSGFAFLAQDGVNPGDALREIMKFTESDMLYSARSSVSFVMNIDSLAPTALDSI